jgi:hypothetical protein
MSKDPPSGFPSPGTEAWNGMNVRRWHLIQKELANGLDAQEQAELDELQRRTLVAVEGGETDQL